MTMNILLTERINSANEYIELLAGAYREEGHQVLFDVQNFLYSDFIPDMLHIHWPEAIYKWRHQLPRHESAVRLIEERLREYKKKGIPIVYTSHNLFPHKGGTDFDQQIYSKIVSMADIIVHHGKASISLLKEQFPECRDARHLVCPHGPYIPVDLDRIQARMKYGLPDNRVVILNFGRQRDNKGPDFINNVFRQLNSRDSFLFSIGPNPPQSRIDRWSRLVRHRLYKMFVDQYRRLEEFRDVDHTEIPGIVASSDIFFLGHQSGLNSGLLVLAISYGKPVIYPDLGNFKEQAGDWPWAESYVAGDLHSATDALERMIEKIRSEESGKSRFDNEKWLLENSWNKSVQMVLEEVAKLKTVRST